MILPELFNTNNLFLNLNGLSINNNHSLDSIKQEIFDRGTSSLLHITRIKQLNETCKKEFNLYENQLSLGSEERIVFSSESVGFLLNEITPLFTSLRLLQNLTMKLLRRFGNSTLPKSINDYFKKPDKFELDKLLHAALNKHWSSTGEQLKHYRDLDQHYFTLTDRYFMLLLNERNVLIELPDNPEEKSLKKFTYNQQINAITFLEKAFLEIHEVFETIAKHFSASPKQHSPSMSMNQLGLLYPNRKRTLALWYIKFLNQNKDENLTLHLECIGIDQEETGAVTMRKYFLDADPDKLVEAKKFYGMK